MPSRAGWFPPALHSPGAWTEAKLCCYSVGCSRAAKKQHLTSKNTSPDLSSRTLACGILEVKTQWTRDNSQYKVPALCGLRKWFQHQPSSLTSLFALQQLQRGTRLQQAFSSLYRGFYLLGHLRCIQPRLTLEHVEHTHLGCGEKCLADKNRVVFY